MRRNRYFGLSDKGITNKTKVFFYFILMNFFALVFIILIINSGNN